MTGQRYSDQTIYRRPNAKSFGLKLSMLGLLVTLALNLAIAQVTPSNKEGTEPRDLLLEPSSVVVPGGTASLTISVLTHQADTYVGNYQLRVSPYFFKSEKGKLSIDAPEETLKKLDSGIAVDFTGQATTSGSGKMRRINGKATPVDHKHGAVNLRFLAGKREMIFNTSYRFDASRERPN